MEGVEDTEGVCCLMYGMSYCSRSGASEAKRSISPEGCDWILFMSASDCGVRSLKGDREIMDLLVCCFGAYPIRRQGISFPWQRVRHFSERV